MTHVLHQSAVELSKKYLQCERDLVQVLQEIQRNYFYIQWGYSSLYDYCRKALLLSEAQAYNFVSVSRRCNEIPELQHAIQSQQINLSRAKRILPVLNSDNASLWIEKAQTMDQRQLEREVATENPAASFRAILKPVGALRSLLHLEISVQLEKEIY